MAALFNNLGVVAEYMIALLQADYPEAVLDSPRRCG
jgi:hypothetical protein